MRRFGLFRIYGFRVEDFGFRKPLGRAGRETLHLLSSKAVTPPNPEATDGFGAWDLGFSLGFANSKYQTDTKLQTISPKHTLQHNP